MMFDFAMAHPYLSALLFLAVLGTIADCANAFIGRRS